MNLGLGQLRALLRVALTVDLRAGNPLGGRRSRGSRAYLFALVFYFFVGVVITAATAVSPLAAGLRITVLLAVAGTYVAFNVLVEYHQILLSPTDGDVLYWRPIASRTLFAARALHILIYVNILTTALLLVPSIAVAVQANANPVVVWCAFVAAGFLNSVVATAFTVLIYGLLLRRVAAQRLLDALAYVQVGMGLVIFLGYQALGPLMHPLAENETVLRWFRVLPAAWFAALPEMLGWGWNPASLIALLVGLSVAVISAFFALHRLAPSYQSDVAAIEVAPQTSTESAGKLSRLARQAQGFFASWTMRNPMRRAGFDFFLSNLQGDRRIKVSLLPIVALPLALVVFYAVLGAAGDPYESSIKTAASSDGGGRSLGSFGLYFAAYFLAFYALSISRTIVSSPSWRAGWVFYAAPMRRFDQFYSGVLWGAFYGLILPAALLMALVLLALWHNPLHVLAHLALPCNLALLAFPLALRLDVSPPFSRAPARHERSRELLLSLLMMLPLSIIGSVHYLFREHSLELVCVGILLGAMSLGLWSMVNRHVSTVLLSRAFDE